MSFERKQVIFTDSGDSCFGEDAVEEIYVISDTLTLEIYEGCEWAFRYVTGQTAGGKLLVDLANCKRFDITMQVPGGIAVEDVLLLSVFDLARMFATNKKGL